MTTHEDSHTRARDTSDFWIISVRPSQGHRGISSLAFVGSENCSFANDLLAILKPSDIVSGSRFDILASLVLCYMINAQFAGKAPGSRSSAPEEGAVASGQVGCNLSVNREPCIGSPRLVDRMKPAFSAALAVDRLVSEEERNLCA